MEIMTHLAPQKDLFGHKGLRKLKYLLRGVYFSIEKMIVKGFNLEPIIQKFDRYKGTSSKMLMVIHRSDRIQN